MEGNVVGFGAAGGKIDLLTENATPDGESATCIGQNGGGAFSKRMERGGIAIAPIVREKAEQGIARCGTQRGMGGIIGVNHG